MFFHEIGGKLMKNIDIYILVCMARLCHKCTMEKKAFKKSQRHDLSFGRFVSKNYYFSSSTITYA